MHLPCVRRWICTWNALQILRMDSKDEFLSNICLHEHYSYFSGFVIQTNLIKQVDNCSWGQRLGKQVKSIHKKSNAANWRRWESVSLGKQSSVKWLMRWEVYLLLICSDEFNWILDFHWRLKELVCIEQRIISLRMNKVRIFIFSTFWSPGVTLEKQI